MSQAHVDPQKHWVLDKSIPLSIIFAILMQVVAFTWFAAKMDARVNGVEEKLVAQKVELDKRGEWMVRTGDRVVILEERSQQTYDVVKRIEVKLEALSERRR